MRQAQWLIALSMILAVSACTMILFTFLWQSDTNFYLVGLLFMTASILLSQPAHYPVLNQLDTLLRWRRWIWICAALSLLPAIVSILLIGFYWIFDIW